MYNAPHSSSTPKKWTPTPTLSAKVARRPEYAASEWREVDEQHAHEPFEAASQLHYLADEFAVEQIQPLAHPLPKHVLAALSLIEQAQIKQAAQKYQEKIQEQALKGPVTLDAKGEQSENAHLPFVPVAYTPVGWDGKPLVFQDEASSQESASSSQDQSAGDDEPAQAQDEWQAQDSDQEASHTSVQDDADASTQPDLELDASAMSSVHEDQAEAIEHLATDASEDDQEQAFLDDMMAHLASTQTNDQDDVLQANEPDPLASGSQEEVSEPEAVSADEPAHQDEVAAEQADSDIDAAEIDESELNNEDSVLSQEAQSDDVEQQIREEQQMAEANQAPETSVIQGVAEEEVIQREQKHYVRGIEDGKKRARQEFEQQFKDQCAVLASVTEQLNAFLQDASKLYEPMKRLSLHIAQQLVLGELSQPTSVIERLVQRCLDEVNFSANGLITLELNEADKALLASQDSQLLAGLRLEVAQDVSTGSVRIKANDTIVEDFVQDRLSAIARQLKLDDESWQKNSALLSQDTPQEPSGE